MIFPKPRVSLGGTFPLSVVRIIVLSQVYWPDTASTAQHLTDLAEALVEMVGTSTTMEALGLEEALVELTTLVIQEMECREDLELTT